MVCDFIFSMPREKNDPTAAAENTRAEAQKSRYLMFGLTQRCEMLLSAQLKNPKFDLETEISKAA